MTEIPESVDEDNASFSSSKLGTKEYWDDVFNRDLDLFQQNGDVGDVWFGMASVKRIVKWFESCQFVKKDSTVLDVGCGNGVTLVNLAKKGYCHLMGVDYSEAAIELARSYTSKEGLVISYSVCNILDIDDVQKVTRSQFDVCVDKGTYDAVSLNPEKSVDSRSLYQRTVGQLVKPQGFFIITTCNWTEPELVKHFEKDFSLFESIPTVSYQFGGQSGQKETVLVLQRKS